MYWVYWFQLPFSGLPNFQLPRCYEFWQFSCIYFVLLVKYALSVRLCHFCHRIHSNIFFFTALSLFCIGLPSVSVFLPCLFFLLYSYHFFSFVSISTSHILLGNSFSSFLVVQLLFHVPVCSLHNYEGINCFVNVDKK